MMVSTWVWVQSGLVVLVVVLVVVMVVVLEKD
jgi:hypothetical protein